MKVSVLKSKFVRLIIVSILATILSRSLSMLKIIPIIVLLYLIFDYYRKKRIFFHLKGYEYLFFSLFCFYSLFLILKAIFYDSNDGILGNFYTSFIGNLEFGLLSFSIPCVVLVIYESKWLEKYAIACDIIIYMGIFVGLLYFIGLNIYSYVFLLYLVPFLCLREIICAGRKVPFILYIAISLYYCWFEDERSILMMSVLSIVVLFVLSFTNNKILQRFIKIFCFAAPLLGVFLTIYNLLSRESFFEYLYSMYSNETTIVQDTRTFLFQELNEDLTKTDTWLFGKGMFGTYYSGVMETALKRGASVDNANRLGTECGYLWLILKGGIIYFIFYFILFYIAVIKAIRQNSKVYIFIGFIIASRLLFMFISFTPAFDVANIFLWSLFSYVSSNKVIHISKTNIYI